MRLFVAIGFTQPFKQAISDCQGALKRASSAGNFSRPENLHLTLAFIGEVRDASAALRAVRSVNVAPFDMQLSGGGRFGTLHWLGVESGGQVESLAAAVRDALRREDVPFDTKPFKSHITLAREVVLSREFKPKLPDAAMTVTRISLMKSERINGKLIYTEIK